MAVTRKPKPKGAGPYTGYSKNYKPVKSSKGTAVEKFVVEKVLGANRDPRIQEAGVSGFIGKILGSAAKEAGKASVKNSGKSIKLVEGVTAKTTKKGALVTAKKVPPKSSLGKGISSQNKSAKTYITKGPRSEAQIKAGAAAGARAKSAFKAKANAPLRTALTGAVVAVPMSKNKNNKPSPVRTTRPSVGGRNK